MDYQGILFPDRAESLGEKQFEGYRVFLNFWDPFAERLRSFYEGLAMRRDSRALLVYGPQGSGKTLFARKLSNDFAQTQLDLQRSDPIAPMSANLWHRVAGGTVVGEPAGKLSRELISSATPRTTLLSFEGDKNWVATARDWVKGQQDRLRVIVMDNAESNYFIQGLVELDDAQYVELAHNPATFSLAAERFVALCRGDLRGCLFLMLTNNDLFALQLDEQVNRQHMGLVTLTNLPLPGSQEKETVVRVNTNRLNRISYWFCLDKAGPEEKMAVYTALRGASTFPESFQAVDNAIKLATPTRIGRPARKCVITLLVLTNTNTVPSSELNSLGAVERTEFNHSWLGVWMYKSDWARACLQSGPDAGLLESEWQLRVVSLGTPFIQALLSDDNTHVQFCGALLSVLQRIHGPGTRDATRNATEQELQAIVDDWPSPPPIDPVFWSQGQTRSVEYEEALRRVFANYNLGAQGFLSYRPDYVVAPYIPCSILAAASGNIEHINAAIKRDAHVFEFTAIEDFTPQAVRTYLSSKLPNYVDVTREQ